MKKGAWWSDRGATRRKFAKLRRQRRLDQTQHILLGLNPITTEDDYILPPEPDGVIIDSFDFEPGFIQCCIRDLSKGSANGASGWSYNVIHQLYANPNEEAAHHLSVLSLFLSSLVNSKLSNHLCFGQCGLKQPPANSKPNC
jgi:hypothetical protein